jgi:hypothetical protein
MQEEQNKQNLYSEDDEITLKQLVEKITEYGKEIRKNWFILFLFCLPTTAYFMYKAFIDNPKYLAKLTFMVNSDESKSGGVASILGQFGLGEGESKDNLDKILALSKTRVIIERAIFKKGTIDGVDDYFANHLIKMQDFQKKWKKDTATKSLINFFYDKKISEKLSRSQTAIGYNLSSFSRTEGLALKEIYANVTGIEEPEALFESSLDKKSGIMTLTLNTRSEELSIKLLEELYTQLGQYYIDKTTEKQRRSYELVVAKADSIESALTGIEYRQADFDDHNRMILFEKAKLPKLRLNRDRTVLNLMFNEAVKNQELAEFALKNKIPYIQSIDMPIAPIRPKKESKIKALIIGIAFGGGFGVIFIVIRKIIRSALA